MSSAEESCSAPCRTQAESLCEVRLHIMKGPCKPFLALTGDVTLPHGKLCFGSSDVEFKFQNLKHTLGNADLPTLNSACGALKHVW